MRYTLLGYGKMGRAIDAIAGERGHRRVAIVDPACEGSGARDRISDEALVGADVAFEFTTPDAAEANVTRALESGVSVVCGSTGWEITPGIERLLAAGEVGAVIAPNFSVGMNLFYRLVREAARLYGPAGLHQPYVVESHHRAKLDAPSGTASHLASIIREADPRIERIHEGNPRGPLPEETLQVASIRAGAEPGTHTVGYDGAFDRITLTHAARSREGFALGAVLAAEFLEGRGGLHAFDEVLERLVDRDNMGETGEGA
jgi:4-hydroxy-tetrahydrodipicolinate reductase